MPEDEEDEEFLGRRKKNHAPRIRPIKEKNKNHAKNHYFLEVKILGN